ncbi:hypothetical protein EVAR_48146_1 [Eumeta japonica]|uniref:Uncharacterized protein n=1 Tax=Eumeta variegata TaxID=151549 RepID=A0A4C1WTK4_EUMVA|nr:hypothetical protein EVAR_48146_1 [Eumeta japonica]
MGESWVTPKETGSDYNFVHEQPHPNFTRIGFGRQINYLLHDPLPKHHKTQYNANQLGSFAFKKGKQLFLLQKIDTNPNADYKKRGTDSDVSNYAVRAVFLALNSTWTFRHLLAAVGCRNCPRTVLYHSPDVAEEGSYRMVNFGCCFDIVKDAV